MYTVALSWEGEIQSPSHARERDLGWGRRFTNSLLNAIEQRLKNIAEIFKKIDRKIDLSFYANFRAALDLAHNAFTMNKAENRRSSALQAINRFLEAEHIYTGYTTTNNYWS